MKPKRTPWENLRLLLTSRPRAIHILVVLISILLGFALSTQIRSYRSDPLGQLDEEALVNLMADLDAREAELREARNALQGQLDELQDAATSAQAAREATAKAIREAEIISGQVPVEGPGITYRVEPGATLPPDSVFVTTLAELRNAGAEAVSLNGVRLAGRSWFGNDGDSIVADSQRLAPPFVWQAIGDPHTLSSALEIRGGASAQFRAYGATVSVFESSLIRIDATVQAKDPTWTETDDS